jgi:Domain of unknown function (DUF6602)
MKDTDRPVAGTTRPSMRRTAASGIVSSDLTAYAGMIGDEFKSKIDRLAKILGPAHAPSVGAYKESILRSCIEQFIPKRYRVGTGFVLFVSPHPQAASTSDNPDIWSYTVSHQLDVIVFDEIDYATIFQDRDFVIVRPESVKAIVEVKGSLRARDVESCIRNYIRLGKSWLEYNQSHEAHVPALLLMAWRASGVNGRSLRKAIVDIYRKELIPQAFDPDYYFPLLNAAYIYDDCAVRLTSYGDGEKLRNAYATNQGKFVWYTDNGEPRKGGDATISSLLAIISFFLGKGFNPEFAYYNQSGTPTICEHKFAGMTDLASGSEVVWTAHV